MRSHFGIGALRACAAVLMTALLASCGGGGGGGAGSSPASSAGSSASTGPEADATAAASADVVSAKLASVPQIRASYLEGDAMPDYYLDVLLGGPVDSLKSLYVVAEDPSALLERATGASPHDDPPGVSLGLVGRQALKPGKYQGNFKIHACVDAACAKELAGSPMLIPYDLDVAEGVQVDRQSINVTVPFGQQAASEKIRITASGRFTILGLALSTSEAPQYNPGPIHLAGSLPQGTESDGPEVNVTTTFDPTQAGTYTDTIRLSPTVRFPDGKARRFERTVTVTYTVTPDPTLDVVFWPDSANVVLTEGDLQGSRTFGPRPVPNTGVTVGSGTLEYLAQPAAADRHPLANRWFTWDHVSACLNYLTSPPQCLPPGTYTARIAYGVTKAGVTTVVYWPITMQIVPR